MSPKGGQNLSQYPVYLFQFKILPCFFYKTWVLESKTCIPKFWHLLELFHLSLKGLSAWEEGTYARVVMDVEFHSAASEIQ